MPKMLAFASPLFAAFIATAQAAPITVNYTATLGFNPTETVGVGGENAAALIDQLFGPGIGSTGFATVTGTRPRSRATTAPQGI